MLANRPNCSEEWTDTDFQAKSASMSSLQLTLATMWCPSQRTTSKSLLSANFVCRVKEEAVAVTKLAELGDSWRHYDCIGIDEGQFYKDVSSLLLNFYSDC